MSAQSLLDQWVEKFHRGQGQQVLQEALAGLHRPPGQRVQPMAVFWVVLALALCLFSLLWAGISITRPQRMWFEVVVALAAALLALQALWRVGQQRWKVLPRETAPELYGLLDQVRKQLNHHGPIDLVLIGGFNAAYTRPVRGRATVFLGAPLLTLLSPQEWVALLAHEVAHGVNGDALRSRWMSFPLRYFVAWHDALDPDGWMLAEGRDNLLTWFTNWIMWGLAQVPRGLLLLLLLTQGRTSQLAEYRADALAARVAGSGATQSTLQKLLLHDVYLASVHKQVRHPERPTLYAELEHQLARLTPEKWQDLRDTATREGHSFDSHPPTRLRWEFLQACSFEAQVHFDVHGRNQALREIHPLMMALQKDILDDYRYHLDG